MTEVMMMLPLAVNVLCFGPQVQFLLQELDEADAAIEALIQTYVKQTGVSEDAVRADIQAVFKKAGNKTPSIDDFPINLAQPITRDLKNARWLHSSVIPEPPTTEDKWTFNDGLLVEDVFAPTEQNVIAMQRWAIGAGAPLPYGYPAFADEFDQRLLVMPFKQVYSMECKYNVLTPEMAKQIQTKGFHHCKDVIYQWTGADATERESIKEAQEIVLMEIQIHLDARLRGFRQACVFANGDFMILKIFGNDIECMSCGQVAKHACNKCNYWYCTLCLNEHIQKRKVHCRCNNPTCDPCKYQSRRSIPVHNLKRTRMCYNHNSSNGCHLVPFGKPTLDSKDEASHGFCPTCGVAFYCSRKCQKQHWHKGGHKQRCALWAAWRLKYKDITKKNARFKEDTSSSRK